MKYKYLFFIPAREGSKQLRNKNIRKIGKKSLLEITINHANKFNLKSSYIYVSTDSYKYKKIIEKKNCNIPFLRSKKNSGDSANIIDAILEFINKSKDKFENIILLQPTSPLRKIDLFKSKIKLLDKNRFRSIISIKNLNRSKEFIFKLDKNKKILLKKTVKQNPNRQKNNRLFTPCGSFYATKLSLLKKNKSFYNSPVYGVETYFPYNIDIDTKAEYKFAKSFKI